MAVIDVIKYEGNNDVLVYKHPTEDFNAGSQLIVHESQEAIFFRDGKAMDHFGAGKYTLIINIIQIVFLIITCVVNSYINMPLWIDIVVECIIIGLLIIQISKGLFFKSRNAEYHENIANTAFMDKFRSDLKIICSINKMPNIQDELNDLLDIALGSDPVTNDKTIELESELMLLIKELDSNIKKNSFDNTNKTLINIREILIERNNICKTGK